MELDEQERELWRQLRRKRDFEGRTAEKRAQLAELRDRRRHLAAAYADASTTHHHLTQQLSYTRHQLAEFEHEIAALVESNRILQGDFRARQGVLWEVPPDLASRDVEAVERAKEYPATQHEEAIGHMRGHLDLLITEKLNLTAKQKGLFEKQHATEQDRNLLLGSLQQDRKAITDLRAERIRLWDLRHAMEKEMTEIAQHENFRGLDHQGRPVPPPPAPPGGGDWLASTRVGGVRLPPTRDTPVQFKALYGPVTGKEAAEKAPSTWTHFSPDETMLGEDHLYADVGGGTAARNVRGVEPEMEVTEWAGKL